MPLEAKQLGFYHRKNQWIFRNMDLKIDLGQKMGLSGPSGCGKTTLAKILAGYLKPSEGWVTAPDSLKRGWNPVQMVLQHPEKAVNPRWRLKDVLAEAGMKNSDLLERFGIESHWLERYPNELSGGELQRFCLVRALNPKTRFLIADEMTTMLDTLSQAQIWHVVLEVIKERHMGLLVVSHEKTLLDHICDEVRYINMKGQFQNGGL